MDKQREAVLELARRYDYSPDHAHQVECLAGTLFVELEELHGLVDEDRKLLEFAAILHDIGYYVRARGHHRHAMQMIMMEPLVELTREQKSLVANVARYHRKALPSREHTAYSILSLEDQRRTDKLAAILRIADALDRSHGSPIRELYCQVDDTTVSIFVSAESEPLAELDAVARKADLFRVAYDREVVVTAFAPRVAEGWEDAKFAFELTS